MKITVITIPAAGQARLRADYAAREIIKDTIPSSARTWNKQQRMWLIDADYATPLAAVLRKHGFSVTLEDHRPPARPAAPRQPQRSWVDQAFDACPPPMRSKLRRALLAVFHPDIGGDTTIAKQINTTADYHERRSA